MPSLVWLEDIVLWELLVENITATLIVTIVVEPSSKFGLLNILSGQNIVNGLVVVEGDIVAVRKVDRKAVNRWSLCMHPKL
jgi:hypothetical protein